MLKAFCNGNIMLGIALATDLQKLGLTLAHNKTVVMFIVPKRSLVSPTIFIVLLSDMLYGIFIPYNTVLMSLMVRYGTGTG